MLRTLARFRRWLALVALAGLLVPVAADAKRRRARRGHKAAAAGPPPPSIECAESVPVNLAEGIPVTVTFAEPPARPVLTATVGRVEQLVDEGEGRYTTTYVPPITTDQVMVVLAAWDDANLGQPGLMRLWLQHPEDAPPGAGVRVATVIVPNRLEAGRTATVFLFVHAGNGTPRNLLPEVDAQRGKLSGPQRYGNGIYVADYRPKKVVGAAIDTVSARAGDIVGWADVLIQGARPATFEVTSSAESLVSDGVAKATITVKLADEAGKPMAGQTVRLDSAVGTVGEVTDIGDGTYTGEYTAPEILPPDRQVTVTAYVGEVLEGTDGVAQEFVLPVRPGPADHANVWAEPRRLPADGASTAQVWVAVLDKQGNPADGTPRLDLGRGSVSALEPADEGQWMATWTAPDMPALEYSERLLPKVTLGGDTVEVKGTLRLDPRPRAAAPPEKPRPASVWGPDVGFVTLFGGGHVAETNGLAVGFDWSWQIGGMPLYVGFDPGLTLLAGSTSAVDEAHVADGVGAVDIEVESALVPLVGNVSLRVRVLKTVFVRAGFGLGALLAFTRATSEVAFGGDADSFEVLAIGSAPVGAEWDLGSGMASLEVQYFRSLGGLSGPTQATVGVVGAIQGLTLSAGWRWSEP